MRNSLLVGSVVGIAGFLAGAVVGAQSLSQNKAIVTLSGCVQVDEASANQVTLSGPTRDGRGQTTYRLTGIDVHPYVGRRVQIAGSYVNRRLQIKGGLVPSANAAAQAGAQDPIRSTISGDGERGTGAGSAALPEFRVRNVKPLTGSCLEP